MLSGFDAKPPKRDTRRVIERAGGDFGLRSDLSSSGGAALVGLDATLNYAVGTIGAAINDVILNVKQFPWLAKGDGVTDDTAAIQAALTHVDSLGGGVIFFPAGSYLLSDALTVPDDTWLRGQGVASVLKCGTTITSGGAGDLGGNRLLHAESKSGFRVTDLKLDMSAQTSWSGAATRCMWFLNCSNYLVSRCEFVTNGAAVASPGGSYYSIFGNKVTFSSTDSAAHHDGLIDQWAGANHFSVIDNEINCAGIGRHGILITGVTTATVAAACHDFVITNNRVYDANEAGIWSNGRDGINYNFHIGHNLVDTVIDFFGIGIADCKDFTVSSNVVKSTKGNGMVFYKEALGGTQAARNGTISANVIIDPNTGLNASGSNGSGIVVDDESQGLTFVGNRVKGTTHVYAVWFDSTTSNNEVIGYAGLDAGTSGTINNFVDTNYTPGGRVYTPTLTSVANVTSSSANSCRFKRDGKVVTVSGVVSVTPTASSTITQLGISLPVASNLTNANTDLSGQATSGFSFTGAISADTVNDRAQLQFTSASTAAHVLYFSFQYTVL